MTSKIVVNNIESDSGISSVTFTSDIELGTKNLKGHNLESTGIVTAVSFTGSGANLTNLPAGNLSGTLPAISAANLTNVPAANITGTLPAIDGSNLTGVGASFGNSSVNTSGIITATAFVSTNQNLSHRNKLINGAMQVNQRGFVGPITNVGGSSSTFTLDRWKFYIQSTSARFTVSKDSDSPDGFGAAMKIDCTTADTSLAALDEAYLEQRIEGQDLQEFAKGTSSAKQYTISFYAKTNKTGTYIVRLLGRDNQASCCSASYTVSLSLIHI